MWKGGWKLVKEALISRTEKLQSELARKNERVRAELKAAEEVSGRLERLAPNSHNYCFLGAAGKRPGVFSFTANTKLLKR